MNFLAAFLASFVAVAVANPVDSAVVRTSALEDHFNCDLSPLLNCTGGLDQEGACDDDGWTCPGDGLHPTTSNATCAAQCICEINSKTSLALKDIWED
ncbi:hypothetical protein C8R47DRAFT_1209706 [Mycena vitilis]|nr:hypothetical protein C8R47DRAFT_1209706 [Mycena vitilis]